MSNKENIDQNSFRNIVKNTSVFGGVQVFNILISILRGKIVAIFLGPSGMGISALLSSTILIIQQISGLGLNFSAVRDISEANAKGDLSKLSILIINVRRLLKITGIIGGLLCISLSSFLSKIAFGNEKYNWSFIFLSAMLFFTTLSNGETSILQGTQQLKKLASSTLIGALFGLIIGIPLYKYWGVQGIVPAMIILSLTTYLTNRYFTRKIQIDKKIVIGYKETYILSKSIISLGIISMIAALIGNLTNYGVNAFISNAGSLNDVGLFQAASSITNQYVAFVFSAMAVDYFPRLSSISYDNAKVREVVNQQSEIVLLIVTPLIVILILTAPLLINIFLSNDFLSTTLIVRWLGFSIIFKAVAFPLGYISFAKGDQKVFFWLEAIYSNAMTLLLNVVFYKFLGLKGLGISFLISYFLYFILINIVVKIRYGFQYNKAFISIFFICFFITSFIFIMSLFLNGILLYSLGTFVLGLLLLYCFKQLDKRINIKGLVKKVANK